LTAPCPFGSHRAEGRLPQSAERLDASLPIRPNEMLIEVDCLNLDSSSMRQIAESCGHDQARMRARIAEIVQARGKMHNPATGSGGVLVGRVAEIGADFPARGIAVGDEICTLVSLTLTPLVLRSIGATDIKASRIAVEGHAILFASGLFTRLPDDIPRGAAMALCDVAGAPGHVAKLARPGQTVCVLGCGRAGLLSLCAARNAMGRGDGLLIGLDASIEASRRAGSLGVADSLIEADLRDPLATHRAVTAATGGRLADLTIVTTNVAGCEGGAILATRPQGRILFFSMATSFSAAALTAEGVGRDVEMIIGNGYTEGWVETAFALYRSNTALAKAFRGA
jgi:L-erythro-3,5-diaminohexanoate dehydrogenase